jgi:hypothetical protein
VFLNARRTFAFVCIVAGCATGSATAAPARRAAALPRPALARQTPPHAALPAPPASRHTGPKRPPAPDLWNPLKRKRMAMPPPPPSDVEYAF